MSAESVRDTRGLAEPHLRYEIEMVAGLVWRMRRQRLLFRISDFEDGPLQDELVDHAGRNADIESFGIHARVLTDFLYRGRGRGQSTDAIASDFFEDPEEWKRLRGKIPAELRTVNDRVGSEMVHLSYDRSVPSRPWDYQAIWRALSNVLRTFVDHASPERAGEAFL